jgi:Rrf2 family iron-sulfur cluster assembly transcriptional regulator
MLLSQTSIYGLRAVATLATLAPGETVTASELSARTGVPRQYLSKVMRKLVLARIARGRRGHGGGFGLMRPPRGIRLADVLAALEQPLNDECVFGYDCCSTEHPCALHPIWARLKECIRRWIDECTMADLGPTPPEPPAPPKAARNRVRTGPRSERPRPRSRL